MYQILKKWYISIRSCTVFTVARGCLKSWLVFGQPLGLLPSYFPRTVQSAVSSEMRQRFWYSEQVLISSA